jgi:hypothetical protein
MPKRATVLLRYGLTPLALAALPMLVQAQGYYEIQVYGADTVHADNLMVEFVSPLYGVRCLEFESGYKRGTELNRPVIFSGSERRDLNSGPLAPHTCGCRLTCRGTPQAARGNVATSSHGPIALVTANV